MIDEIKNDPAARILEQYLYTQLGGFISCDFYYHQGVIAGSEFLTYAANKIYMAIEFKAGTSSVADINAVRIEFYNEANVQSFVFTNNVAFWNTAGAAINYGKNCIDLKHIYFSRIVNSQNTHMIFNGYKIIY